MAILKLEPGQKQLFEVSSVEEVEGNFPGTFRKCAGGRDDEPGRAPYHHWARRFKRRSGCDWSRVVTS